MSSSTLPALTTEQKAAAFDELCHKCDHHGELIDYAARESISGKIATVVHNPRYRFTLVHEGQCPTFKQLLIAMASRY